MSLEIIEKKHLILKKKASIDDNFNYSNVIIPFSNFFHKIELLDIYSGNENIPFADRDSKFKKILLTEFL